MLRYTQWRTVIAEYTATRLNLQPDDLLPQIAGRISLALAFSADDAWLNDPASDLLELLEETKRDPRSYFNT